MISFVLSLLPSSASQREFCSHSEGILNPSETSGLKMASMGFFSGINPAIPFVLEKPGNLFPFPIFSPLFSLSWLSCHSWFPFISRGGGKRLERALWDSGVLWDLRIPWDLGILWDTGRTWMQRGPGMDDLESGNAASGAAFPN